MKTVGEQAKEFRLAKGWSYTRMAEEVTKNAEQPVSRQLITQLEDKGDRTPHYLRALAVTMATTADTLLEGRYVLPPVLDVATSMVVVNEPSSPTFLPPNEERSDLVIPQYQAGGSMGAGLELEEEAPGIIKSWRVEPEWLRRNVPVHTGAHNLCIVTGFGPSMRPLYNPGDPLLMDRGVKKVETEGVFFFRVGTHGFIKQLQRIPTEAGLILRAKSLNPSYDPFDISKNMDFECFGKILTVWESKQV